MQKNLIGARNCHCLIRTSHSGLSALKRCVVWIVNKKEMFILNLSDNNATLVVVRTMTDSQNDSRLGLSVKWN